MTPPRSCPGVPGAPSRSPLHDNAYGSTGVHLHNDGARALLRIVGRGPSMSARATLKGPPYRMPPERARRLTGCRCVWSGQRALGRAIRGETSESCRFISWLIDTNPACVQGVKPSNETIAP